MFYNYRLPIMFLLVVSSTSLLYSMDDHWDKNWFESGSAPYYKLPTLEQVKKNQKATPHNLSESDQTKGYVEAYKVNFNRVGCQFNNIPAERILFYDAKGELVHERSRKIVKINDDDDNNKNDKSQKIKPELIAEKQSFPMKLFAVALGITLGIIVIRKFITQKKQLHESKTS